MGTMREMYFTGIDARSEMPLLETNKVSLGKEVDGLGQPRAHVNLQLPANGAAKRTWTIIGEEILRSGLGRVAGTKRDPQVTGGGHFMCTTRMGYEPSDSIVDANCRVHHLNNTYVAGSSIFSAGAAINPTMSIVAFALRLAQHLGDRG